MSDIPDLETGDIGLQPVGQTVASNPSRTVKRRKQWRTPEEYETMEKHFLRKEFRDEYGQALLFAFGNSERTKAKMVRVHRPCARWKHEARESFYKQHLVQDPGSLEPKSSAMFDPLDRLLKNKKFEKSERDIWIRIRQAWLDSRPIWQRCIPFWRPLRLEERELEITSVDKDDPSSLYVKVGDKLDLEEIRRKAKADLREKSIFELEHGDYCSTFLRYDGSYSHVGTETCDGAISCITFKDAIARHRIDSLKHLSEFFARFKAPQDNDGQWPLLCGMAQDSCIYDHREFARKSQKQPPTFNGLYLTVGLEEHEWASFGTVTLTVVVVVAWKIMTGDWSAAAGIGSLFVALLTLAFMKSQQKHGGI